MSSNYTKKMIVLVYEGLWHWENCLQYVMNARVWFGIFLLKTCNHLQRLKLKVGVSTECIVLM